MMKENAESIIKFIKQYLDYNKDKDTFFWKDMNYEVRTYVTRKEKIKKIIINGTYYNYDYIVSLNESRNSYLYKVRNKNILKGTNGRKKDNEKYIQRIKSSSGVIKYNCYIKGTNFVPDNKSKIFGSLREAIEYRNEWLKKNDMVRFLLLDKER